MRKRRRSLHVSVFCWCWSEYQPVRGFFFCRSLYFNFINILFLNLLIVISISNSNSLRVKAVTI